MRVAAGCQVQIQGCHSHSDCEPDPPLPGPSSLPWEVRGCRTEHRSVQDPVALTTNSDQSSGLCWTRFLAVGECGRLEGSSRGGLGHTPRCVLRPSVMEPQ